MVRIFREIATSLGAIAPDLGLVPPISLFLYHPSLFHRCNSLAFSLSVSLSLSLSLFIPPFLRPRSFHLPTRANTFVARVCGDPYTYTDGYTALWSRPRITSSIRRPAPSTTSRRPEKRYLAAPRSKPTNHRFDPRFRPSRFDHVPYD